MIGLCTLAAGLVVGPGAHLHLRKVELARKAELHNVERNVELRMCDAEAPAPAGRSPSVLTEMRSKFKDTLGGFYLDELKEEMKTAYDGVAGKSDSPDPNVEVEITLDQYTTLMANLGDALPADRLKAMFEAVDTNADGKIEYVKFYKSVVDEAMGVEPESGGGGGGGGGGGFSFGSLFGKK